MTGDTQHSGHTAAHKEPLIGDATLMSATANDGGSPGVYMPIPMIIYYGENKEFHVNPNAGFASVMQYIQEKLTTIGVADSDHIELCDEHGTLINPDDFPSMMFVTSFIKPGTEEATFLPAKVTRDEHKKVTKIDVLLKDSEHNMPEIYNKLKKQYHIHTLDMKAKRQEKEEEKRLTTAPPSPKTPRGVTPFPGHARATSITGKKTGKAAAAGLAGNRHSKDRTKKLAD